MRIELQPLSNPELGVIAIEEGIFPIGRIEEPFSGSRSPDVSRLSRRHARLFEQDGRWYLVDSGSINGTEVNGKSVTRAVALKEGDEICFGGHLRYRAVLGKAPKVNSDEIPSKPPGGLWRRHKKVSAHETAAQERASPRLILMPCVENACLNPVVVTDFPFLIGKLELPFQACRDSLANAFKRVSRRHAYVYCQDNRLYIEDLGSTNGTFLNAQRLDEKAHELKDGDLIAFGSEQFGFKVAVVPAEVEVARPMEAQTESTQAPTTAPISENSTAASSPSEVKDKLAPAPVDTPQAGLVEDGAKTLFVTKAASFLDIYCQTDEPGKQENQTTPTTAAPAGQRRWRRALSDLRRAWGGQVNPAVRRQWRWALVGVVLLGMVAGVGYWQGAVLRDMERLIEAGQYPAAAAMAEDYLREHPDHERAMDLGLQAILNMIVPGWQQSLKQADSQTHQTWLTQGRELSRSNPEARQAMALLAWIDQLAPLTQAIEQAGGPVLFQHEERIQAALNQWDQQAADHRRLLRRLVQTVPAFEPVYYQVFSQLRHLRKEQAVNVTAMRRLRQTLEEQLATPGEQNELSATLQRFAEQYPEVQGVAKVQAEVAPFLAYQQAVADKDVERLAEFETALAALSPPFQQRVKQLQAQALPSTEVLQRYRQAAQDWSRGALVQAIRQTEQLVEEVWGDVAQRRLERYRQLQQTYRELQQTYGELRDSNAVDTEKLVVFYGALTPGVDDFLIAKLREPFLRHKEQGLIAAQAALGKAQAAWKEYVQQGGINGALRLEQQVSNQFKRQAKRLTEAAGQVERGIRMYQQLDAQAPPEQQQLHTEILAEAMRQRRWLQELDQILASQVMHDKLQLLASTTEGTL